MGEKMATQPTTTNDSKWMGILETAKYMIVSTYHVGALARNGLITRKHGTNGHYIYDVVSCDKYMKSQQQKQIDKQNAILAQLNGKHARPTSKSCKRMIKKIQNDDELTMDEQNTFIALINKYEHEWDVAYAISHHVTTK